MEDRGDDGPVRGHLERYPVRALLRPTEPKVGENRIGSGRGVQFAATMLKASAGDLDAIDKAVDGAIPSKPRIV
jgi:hypothetical protein